MKFDLDRRLGFLVGDIARRYGHRYDLLAREQIGLTRAQARLLVALAVNAGEPLTQVQIAGLLELSTMGVASLCDRMEAAGWIRRETSASDRRAKEVHLQPAAEGALHQALAISDQLQAKVYAGFDAAERRQLIDLLQRVQANLKALGAVEVSA